MRWLWIGLKLIFTIETALLIVLCYYRGLFLISLALFLFYHIIIFITDEKTI